MPETDPILELSTHVEPPKIFKVDDTEYQLLGLEHLSAADEAKATALFTRFGQLVQLLDSASNDRSAEQVAQNLRNRRIDLISLLTTIPRATAETLPLRAQVQLFQAIQRETGREELDDGALS